MLNAEFLAFQDAVAGQYSLERELGRGGMGIVYLAREVSLDRHVAIKLLPPALAMRDELRERFMREARTAARLSHPHIVPIHRVDRAGAFVYFAMAFVDGETLSARIARTGPLAPAEATRMLREVAWALAYAHANGIVHRDIKPDNILLERGSGRALVTDFGIAHVATNPAITEEGRIVGTAHFMSPEQAAGEPVDGRSDLYALGCVGYFALTGRMPFDAPSAHAVLAKHLTQPVPSVADQARTAPPALCAALERCMAKDPDGRWGSGEELAAALATTEPAPRTLPAPLRLWLNRGEALLPLYAVWSTPFALIILNEASHAEFNPVYPALMLAPWGFHAAVRAIETRRVLRDGYTLRDLRDAIHIEQEQRHEEYAADMATGPTLAGRILRLATYGMFAAALATLVAWGFAGVEGTVPGTDVPVSGLFGMFLLFGVVGGVAGIALPGRAIRAGGLLERLKVRFWDGPLGERYVKALMPKRRERRPVEAVQRPTEMAIAFAVDDLFAALPAGVRDGARDLPAVAARLEADAAAMRARVELLDEQLGQAAAQGDAVSSAVAAFASAEAERLAADRARLIAELRAARDAAGRRLAAAVAALESLRLDLLRLHAGTGDARSLTATLEAARRAGEEIDTLVRAASPTADLARR